MNDRIQKITSEIESFVASGKEELEQFRLKYLSKKGEIQELFKAFRDVPPEQRRELGKSLNALKKLAHEKFDHLASTLQTRESTNIGFVDLTRPAEEIQLGSRHPISLVNNRIINIFSRIGFTVSEGPEIEDDWHNFTALNFPEEHPARDMQDTFFLEKDPDVLLRTHTSSVQVRVMKNSSPPIRTISPGRVFRNEAISARSHCIFHQIEGLYIDRDVSFADLKQTLYYFAREFLGPNTQVRFRPSYFPFTEPSAEMDVTCKICHGKGCNVCKFTGWLEILGCGMVDPNVLDKCGIDSSVYSGYAFGIGIERTAMTLFQIKDIRLYFENDLRFLKQFTSAVE
ncbi:MAG: phenylalanine--tRNA ligase subunit alpha [Bacteroidales bacterium]